MSARKFWLNMFRISLVLFTCIPGLHLKDRFFPHLTPADHKITCHTPECIGRAQMYLRNMMPQAKPCEDFYEYACGNWENENPRPPYMQEWTVYSVVAAKTTHQIQDILENELKYNPAGNLYRTCLKMPYLKRGDAEFLKMYLKGEYIFPIFLKRDQKHFAHPTRWSMIDNYFMQVTGESALFDTDFKANTKRNNEPLLDLHDLYSPYGSIFRIDPWEGEDMRYYEIFLYTLIERLAPRKMQASRSSIQKDIEDVIFFRCNIQQIIEAEAEDTYNPYNPITIKELQEWYDKHTDKPGQIKWLETIQSLCGKEVGQKMHGHVTVNLNRKLYFIKLAKLIDMTPERTIINHIFLYFLERHIELDEALKNILKKTVFRYTTPTGIIRYSVERWIHCIKHHNLKNTIGKQYVKNYLLEDDREKVKNIIGAVQDIIEVDVTESTWIDGAIKEMVLEKIRRTVSWIGYPAWYDDPDSKKNYQDVRMDPTIANANYASKRNLLLINAAVLQDPLYNPDLPPALQAATIGFIIGHEQYHAFDDKNIYYDYKGVDQSSMWSKRMNREYDNKKSCFLDQYKNYRIKELEHTCRGAKCNAELTYNENLADTMGLKTAYKMHRKIIERSKGKCYVLPGFEHLSCDGMFFLAFANSLCGVIPNEYLRRQLEFAVHSTPRLRVNGAIANMKAFKRAYDCKTQNSMSPSKRCDLWS